MKLHFKNWKALIFVLIFGFAVVTPVLLAHGHAQGDEDTYHSCAVCHNSHSLGQIWAETTPSASAPLTIGTTLRLPESRLSLSLLFKIILIRGPPKTTMA